MELTSIENKQLTKLFNHLPLHFYSNDEVTASPVSVGLFVSLLSVIQCSLHSSTNGASILALLSSTVLTGVDSVPDRLLATTTFPRPVSLTGTCFDVAASAAADNAISLFGVAVLLASVSDLLTLS